MPDNAASTSSSKPLWPWRWAAIVMWLGMFIGSHGVRFDLLESTVQVGNSAGGLPIDKIVHFSCFSLLTWLVWCSRLFGPPARLNLVLAAVIVCVYGAFDEITQGMMGRDCELSDWLADAMAAWCVLLSWWPVGRRATTWPAAVARYVLCIGVCVAEPVRAVWSKVHGGPFSRDAIEVRQYFVLGFIVVAAVILIAVTSFTRTRRSTTMNTPAASKETIAA